MKAQKYIAELIGTFFLAMAVAISLMQGSALPTPVVAGLTLGLFVYTIGSVSGAHLNPAVTIAMASVKKISWKEAGWYIVFQLIGGVLALYVSHGLTGVKTLVENFPVDANLWKISLVEAIGAFILVWGVSSVVHKKSPEDVAGIVVGGSLLLGIMLAGTMSFGVLNPAVAIGIGVDIKAGYSYLIGPVIGGVISALLYRWLAVSDKSFFGWFKK